MNPVKLILAVIVIFTLLAVETNSSFHLHGYGWGLTPAFLPIYLATAKPRRHVSLLLLLKLLALKKTLLIATPAVAIGSLVVGSGAGLLAGKLGTLAMLNHLQPYKETYHYYKHVHGGGWGFRHHHKRIKGHHRVTGYLLSSAVRQAHRTLNWVQRIRHAHKYFVSPHGWGKHVQLDHGHDHGHGHHAHSYYIPTHHSHARSHRHVVPTHYHATQSPGYAHDHGYSEPHYSPAEYYNGGHPTEDTSNHGLSFNSGPPYLGSGDVLVEESQMEETIAARQPEKPKVLKTSDAEYFAGVMSHVAEPITDFINGVTTVLGGKAYKPTAGRTVKSATAEPIDPSTGKLWEFPGLSAKESEKYLEQHFEQLKSENPKEGMSLIRVLRQAYSLTLADLGYKNENKIPDFIPIPMSEKDKESRRRPQLSEPPTEESPTEESPTEEPSLDYDVSNEVGQFFALISSFDNETCFQKLVCDIHTRVNETTAESFTPYEENLLAVFRMLGTVLNEDLLDSTTAKYLAAAKFGAENESSELCQARYPVCQYSSNEIMDMGIELESASPFSIPGYLVSKLGSTLNDRQAQQLLTLSPIEEIHPSL